MIDCPTVTSASIRRHYDLLSPFYRVLWGRHVHHGLWDEGDAAFALSPDVAQLKLTDTLADLAGIGGGQRVLDVGCGMGGSAIHLAETRGCHVTGLTISRVQQMYATASALRHGVGGRRRPDAGHASFRREDAERVAFDAGSFDVLWSVECTEHLFQKAAFFNRAARWLAPGGRLAVCAWVAGDEPLSEPQRDLAYRVCEGMFCPSLGSTQDYEGWFRDAGLEAVESRDWTARVAKTWEICLDRVNRSGTGRIAPLFGRDAVLFLSRFQTMLDAYDTGAMRYVAFTARKPG